MIFDKLSIALFNENNVYFHLLVYEEEKTLVYKDIEQKIIAGDVKDINYKFVQVEEIINIDSELYFSINFRNTIKGYFKPKNSIIFIPKEKQQIKLKKKTTFNNDLNIYLNIDEDIFKEVKRRISFSSYYVLFENEVYESIIHQNEMVGFFKLTDVSKLYRANHEFEVIKESNIYKDSLLTKKIDIIKPSTVKYTSELVSTEDNVIRFKTNGVKAWIHEANTNIKYRIYSYPPQTPSETLMKSILYQYRDKLQKSHSYHLKIMKEEMNR